MAIRDLVVVKLGGSVITDKKRPFTLKYDVIRRLGSEISEAAGGSPVIIVHGGGSYAHPVAKKYSVAEGYKGVSHLRGFIETSIVVRKLSLEVVSCLVEGGLRAISIPAAAIFITRSRKITSCNLEPIFSALRVGVIPVTSGDVVFDRDLGFTVLSGDAIAAYLASRLRAKKLIYAVDVDGVYVRDVASGEVKVVGEFSRGMRIEPVGGGGEDVTGGIVNKLEEGFVAAESGVDVILVNGLVEGRVGAAISGRSVPGTRLRP
ncbi:MAG: isopentenyl phosphate kinase [Nitrososphaeria archaeon]|nr:isopentenyl phosphate kinase [Nitrososphaeria archaeon]